MLAICPNPQCRQKVVLVEGYGPLPLDRPGCPLWSGRQQHV
jgi:hypothetical protein